MIMKNKMVSFGLCLVLICALSACWWGSPGREQLVNTFTGSLSGIKNIRLDYAVGGIKLLPARNDEILVMEYATNSYRPEMFARLEVEGDTLVVRQGSLRNVNNVSITVEVYLPLTFSGSLELDAAVGMLSIQDAFAFSSLDVEIDVGDINIAKIAPDSLVIAVDVGDITWEVPKGYEFTYDISIELGEVDSSLVSRGRGQVGDNPTAQVEISVEVGALEVTQGR